MLKNLAYFTVMCLGLMFVKGDKPAPTRIEETVYRTELQEVENSKKPMIPRGSVFYPVKIDFIRGRGIYQGPDGFYYHVIYSKYDNSIYVEDVFEGKNHNFRE